jgi:hypothetical protein
MSPNRTEHAAQDGYYAEFERRVAITSGVLGAGILLLSLLFVSKNFALSFLVAALVSHWNFSWMKQGLDCLLAALWGGNARTVRRAQWGVLIKYLLRCALIGGFLYVIFRFRFFDTRAVAVGLFLSIAAILAEAAIQLFKILAEDRKHGTR